MSEDNDNVFFRLKDNTRLGKYLFIVIDGAKTTDTSTTINLWFTYDFNSEEGLKSSVTIKQDHIDGLYTGLKDHLKGNFLPPLYSDAMKDVEKNVDAITPKKLYKLPNKEDSFIIIPSFGNFFIDDFV